MISPKPRPILFVGDIHGCAVELEALLEKVGFSPSQRRLIPVGDAFNRGPDSPRVLAVLRQAEAEPLLGNHEQRLLRLAEHKASAKPLPPVALSPQSAYTQFCKAGVWEEAVAAMRSWPLWRCSAKHPGTLVGASQASGRKHWLAVHAGIHPVLAVEATNPHFLTNVRHCNAQGEQPSPLLDGGLRAPRGYRAWFYHHRAMYTVVFGHWGRRGLVRRPRLYGLDTGCVYGGALSALLWPENRLVQVPAKKAYA